MVERASFVGQHVGNYRLVQLLGTGGFAEVYLGMHVHLNTHVAVKLLHTRLANEDVEDFRREAQMIAKLMHPNIIRVLDFGVEANTPYLVMDYAPDGTLRQRHPKGSIIAPQLVIGYVRQIAEALQHAHELRLIHRDVKPENMLLGRNNEVLLSDFGIALAAQSSQYQSTQNIAGTISYMAPEQIQAHPRPASDQYSLGVVVYEWLSGNRPFQGSFTEIAVKHAMAPPAPLRERLPYLPPAVEEVVMIALAKDPHRRFVNVRAFAQAFEYATLQNASPHPSLLASQITLLGPNVSSGLPAMGGTMTYVPGTNATSLHNNKHSTAVPYSASGQSMIPGSGSYASGVPNSYATGSTAMSGQGTGWGQGMPYGPGGNSSGQYGSASFGPGENQSEHYGNGPLSQIRQGEMNQMGGTFRPYGSQSGGDRQKRRVSRRRIIAGMVGLVTASSALTWAIASHQGSTTF